MVSTSSCTSYGRSVNHRWKNYHKIETINISATYQSRAKHDNSSISELVSCVLFSTKETVWTYHAGRCTRSPVLERTRGSSDWSVHRIPLRVCKFLQFLAGCPPFTIVYRRYVLLDIDGLRYTLEVVAPVQCLTFGRF